MRVGTKGAPALLPRLARTRSTAEDPQHVLEITGRIYYFYVGFLFIIVFDDLISYSKRSSPPRPNLFFSRI